MDVITISSDSEASLYEADVTLKKSNTLLWQNEDFYTDFNDDDRPAVDYFKKFSNKEVANQNIVEDDIEDFITPTKYNQGNVSINDVTIIHESPKQADSLTSEPDSEICSQYNSKTGKTKQRQKLSQEEKQRDKMSKEQKKLEREQLKEKKKAEMQKQKALKAAISKNIRNLKPEENIKFLKIHIDNEIINSTFGGNLITLLQENNIQYVIEPQIQKFTVNWSKTKREKTLDELGELSENLSVKEKNILLYVLHWKKAVELIHNNELLSHIETVKSSYYNKKLTVIIFGLKKYFNYKKCKRNNEIRTAIYENKKSRIKASDKVFEEVQDITKDQLEFALIDLQLIGNYNVRLIETPEEFSSAIYNFTKSLSKIEYKLERQKRQKTDFGWVPTNSYKSVKVDKNGNGLLRVWQQQITQFNAVGIEVAQAIASQYKSPLALVNEYENLRNIKKEELLLQDIQIRRGAEILSTSRRVGPMLSKKIHKFLTCDDPDSEL